MATCLLLLLPTTVFAHGGMIFPYIWQVGKKSKIATIKRYFPPGPGLWKSALGQDETPADFPGNECE